MRIQLFLASLCALTLALSAHGHYAAVGIEVNTYPASLLRNEPALQLAEAHVRSSLTTDYFQRQIKQCSTRPDYNLHVNISISLDIRQHSSNFKRRRRSGEGFVIEPRHDSASGHDGERKLNMFVHGQGVLGATYALFHIAERCQLRPCTCWDETSRELEPSFILRTLSEEGQLLDLPDVSYRSEQGPDYLNSVLIQQECKRLLQLVPYMMQHRFNSITILHHDMEEYVEYLYLDGVEVYSKDDPHRNRSLALSALIKDFVHKMQSYHLEVFFQPYEVSCPPQLCDKLHLYAGSPDLERVLIARYKEFFERTDADGIIVTVSDSWSPRAGYVFRKVWSNATELAQVATAFFNAVEKECGKNLIFRLWQWHGMGDWETLVANTPNQTAFSVKVTAGDFLLNQPIHPVLNSPTACKQRPIMVLVDIFRQYDGWGRTLCYVQQWKDRLQQASKYGVEMLNIWGAWSPGCTWPDSGPQLVNGSSQHVKSWQGLWNNYRVFLPTPNITFSGARANAYLIYRLGWNVEDELLNITKDFSSLYFGAKNSQPITDILYLTQQTYLTAQRGVRSISDYGLLWATVFNPDSRSLQTFAKSTSFEDLQKIDQLVVDSVNQMTGHEAQVDKASLPNETVWNDFQLAMLKTQLHVLTLSSWRDIFLLNSTLGAKLPASNLSSICHKMNASLSDWSSFMAKWNEMASEEGADWEFAQKSPKLASRPDFFHGWVSANDYVDKIRPNYMEKCRPL